jgi:hypothetical protein
VDPVRSSLAAAAGLGGARQVFILGGFRKAGTLFWYEVVVKWGYRKLAVDKAGDPQRDA